MATPLETFSGVWRRVGVFFRVTSHRRVEVPYLKIVIYLPWTCIKLLFKAKQLVPAVKQIIIFIFTKVIQENCYDLTLIQAYYSKIVKIGYLKINLFRRARREMHVPSGEMSTLGLWWDDLADRSHLARHWRRVRR